MTLSSTQNRVVYTGNGVTTDYSANFLFYEEEHAVVTVDDVVQVLNVDYIVLSGIGDPAGITIRFQAGSIPADPAPDADNVVIERIVPLDQDADPQNFDGNPADSVEIVYDLMVMRLQQLQDQLDRTPALSISTTLVGVTFPDPLDGEFPIWNGNLGAMANSGVNVTTLLAAETNAAASEAAAAISETNAATSEGNAATSETNAATSEGNAATSETNAAASALAAQVAKMEWQGAWVTATAYALNDVVEEGGSSYICINAHTSGVFLTDLGNLEWELVAQKGADGAGTGDLIAANNLSDVVSAATSRSNLGLAIGSDVQAYDANNAVTDAVQGYTAQQYFAEQALTYAANISWNLNTQQTARVILTGGAQLDDPTNMQAGATYIVRVIQDGVGGHALTFDSSYLFADGTAFTVSSDPNAIDVLTFYCDGTNMYGVGQGNFS